MGPTLIFDKSALQSLNADEAMWLDNFFLTNITPLFYVEVLADLEKEVKAGRTPEQVVGELAYKSPDMSSKPGVHHARLLESELLGLASVEMHTGRPIIAAGQRVNLAGKTGIIFRRSPEEDALLRWHRKEFLDLERQLAKDWRLALSAIDLEASYVQFKPFFQNRSKPKSLAEVKACADDMIDKPRDIEKMLRFGLNLVGLSAQGSDHILKLWRASGPLSIRDFAPYFRHVFGVDLFFYLGIAADQIGRGRPSHRIDLAYLYYLPFTMIFTSGDKFHINSAPLFLRGDQSFIPAPELKAELARLDAHYSELPEATRSEGVSHFAHYPPPDDRFLVSRMWDRYMSKDWRSRAVLPRKISTTGDQARIIKEVNDLRGAPPVEGAPPIASDKADQMLLERQVYMQKGKWKRFPPEVKPS